MAGLVLLRFRFAVVLTGLTAALSAGAASAADDPGFESIFDGKSLDGWDGNPKFWSVRDGAITGETTAENPTPGNTFLVWRKGEVGDFELTAEFKMIGHNSGIQYRSRELPDQKWVLAGYQGDFEAGDTYSGINYDEKGRGILAQRGQQTVIRDDGKPEVVGQLRDSAEIQSHIKKEDWNEYRIIADGFTFVHSINGYVTSIVTDEDVSDRDATGLLGLQLHAGKPMTVQFRNIRLKRLDGKAGAEPGRAAKQSRLEIRRDGTIALDGAVIDPSDLPDRLVSLRRRSAVLHVVAEPTVSYERVRKVIDRSRDVGVREVSLLAEDTKNVDGKSADGKKKIVFVAGRQSHGYGAHEHKAGCMLLAEDLKASGLPVDPVVVTNGWPKDESVFDGAAAVVIYADGGPGHPAVAHLDSLKALEGRGVGIVCLHYGVEVPKGAPGEAFLDAIGGYFEPDWSVNPHWTASYEDLPRHPITRGVKPFRINDEWYYHMRFRPDMQGVTPILTDVPPKETLSRPDGPHEGNPAVRDAVAKGQPQSMAWAYERPDGGRGFGFTGGHVHWNWGNTNFRRLVLNAIVWAAKLDVPEGGAPTRTLSVSDLEANQDEPTPADHNPARIQAMLDEWNR